MEKQYALPKWFGSGFTATLPKKVLFYGTHKERHGAAKGLAVQRNFLQKHNQLTTEPMSEQVSIFHGRPFMVIHGRPYFIRRTANY
jgi:hypothetical protein